MQHVRKYKRVALVYTPFIHHYEKPSAAQPYNRKPPTFHLSTIKYRKSPVIRYHMLFKLSTLDSIVTASLYPTCSLILFKKLGSLGRLNWILEVFLEPPAVPPRRDIADFKLQETNYILDVYVEPH